MHRVAIARTEGFDMTFQDTDALPRATPRLTPLFPNGEADVNEFNRVGGTAFLLRELLNSGLIHDDVDTVMGHGLSQYTQALSYAPADQGPRACDMRELHQLTPTLSVLLERGLKVALVTIAACRAPPVACQPPFKLRQKRQRAALWRESWTPIW